MGAAAFFLLLSLEWEARCFVQIFFVGIILKDVTARESVLALAAGIVYDGGVAGNGMCPASF